MYASYSQKKSLHVINVYFTKTHPTGSNVATDWHGRGTSKDRVRY